MYIIDHKRIMEGGINFRKVFCLRGLKLLLILEEQFFEELGILNMLCERNKTKCTIPVYSPDVSVR